MINWPAVLKYANEDELIFIADQTQWDKDPDLFYYAYEAEDLLIDSVGNIYSLTHIEDHYVTPTSNGDSICLAELSEMVKAHMSISGQCCVAKLSITDCAEAISMVGEVE